MRAAHIRPPRPPRAVTRDAEQRPLADPEAPREEAAVRGAELEERRADIFTRGRVGGGDRDRGRGRDRDDAGDESAMVKRGLGRDTHSWLSKPSPVTALKPR